MTKEFKQNDFLFGSNSIFIEELYQKYLQDPNSVDSSWLPLFNGEISPDIFKSTAKIIIQDDILIASESKQEGKIKTAQENFLRAKFMILAYREHGHYLANLDPLGLEIKKTKEELKLNIEDFGFDENHLSEIIEINNEINGIEACTLSELVAILENIYCRTIAAEFSHLENSEEQQWLYEQFEKNSNQNFLSNDEKKKLLRNLVEVEGFEQYLHTKFPGAKRFSIEGGDASIVCLEKVIEDSAASGIQEAVLGLAHRGRLSTLTKVMEKPYRAIFSEFNGTSAFPTDLDISGDVKYHMGFSSDRLTESGHTIHLSLTPNPSHLEAVNPVVAGKVRAKQDHMMRDRSKVLGILVHGDAAFCGQGVVAECLVMSGLKPYDVGGILHLVINNQIGFTANSFDARPGRYCTEVAKMVGAPILHVNGEDIEAVLLATKIACQYRAKFMRDVVIDIVCYRKYGHNEGDEPMYTQGVMYNIIKKKDTPGAIYAKKLIEEKIIDSEYFAKEKQDFKMFLDEEYDEVAHYKPKAQWLEGNWSGFTRLDTQKTETGVVKSELQEIGKSLCKIPESFDLNPKLGKLFASRIDDLINDKPIDWATAEQLAFATLLKEQIPVRMTGQDVGRGTFSHRHAVLHSQTSNKIYEPLNNISEDQAYFEIADSNLSEYGVLGFEYGYSLVTPEHLVIWEAQFGDFCNGAQIIFDQFIASAETKWLRMSGLVVLLPHGLEGQGPEHSSARLERFLQLTAEDNIQVVYPTTPASIFHLLRRQVKRNFRKPLIVMTPKSLLRHKLAVSNLDELGEGTSFMPIIDEIDSNITAVKVQKVIFCTGKIYYDLLEMRRQKEIVDTAIVRIEQLFPFEEEMMVQVMKKYINAAEFVWCQEEPQNMGAWEYIRSLMQGALLKAGVKKEIKYFGRKRAASPAVGYLYIHNKQQEAILKDALSIKN